MYHSLPIYPLMDILVASEMAVINRAIINTSCRFLYDHGFSALFYIARNVKPRSHDESILTFVINNQTVVFQNGCYFELPPVMSNST